MAKLSREDGFMPDLWQAGEAGSRIPLIPSLLVQPQRRDQTVKERLLSVFHFAPRLCQREKANPVHFRIASPVAGARRPFHLEKAAFVNVSFGAIAFECPAVHNLSAPLANRP